MTDAALFRPVKFQNLLFSTIVYSNICLILLEKREINVVKLVLHFCISHDVFLPESNPKI